jgi:hypothetical protein
MTEKTKPTVIIIHETVATSVTNDLVSFGTLSASIYVGHLLDSGAMQWIAGILWLLWVLSRAGRFIGDKRNHLTIEQARARLDAIERGEE